MINEEVSDKTLNLEIKAAKINAKLIIQQIKKLLKEAENLGEWRNLSAKRVMK